MQRTTMFGVAAVAVLAVACGSGDDASNDQSAPWGPLAVIDEPATTRLQSLGGRGELTINKHCVTLQRDDRTITLVWRNSQTSWDAEGSRIHYDDSRLGSVELTTGMRIEVGGAATIDTDGGVPLGSPDWLAEPDKSCPSELFTVHSVDLLDR